jgi:signal transduction histidine kinase
VLIVRPDGTLLGPAELQEISGLPNQAGVDAARAGSTDVREVEVSSIPIRVYSVAVARPDGSYVVQVLGERSSEVQLLSTLLSVLAVGGLVALLLALAAGYVYAGRALIPVRASMDRRDAALRRQREFTANASHELRTPLTVIRTSVADLRRNRKQPVEKVGEALDDIDAEVSHLTALVEDLLLLARTDSGALALDRTPLDFADVAVEAVGPLTPIAAQRGVLLEADPRPAMVSGDPLRLRQLVTILTDNALAHSPTGTTVDVRIRPEGPDVVLTVDDQGPGIREEDLPRIFERFWRADNAPAGGTGLGLSIAAWIVEAHGGTIAATNRPEGGARFEVRLPASAPKPPAA